MLLLNITSFVKIGVGYVPYNKAIKHGKKIYATKLVLLSYPASSKQIDLIMYRHLCHNYYYYYNQTYLSDPQPTWYGCQSKSQ